MAGRTLDVLPANGVRSGGGGRSREGHLERRGGRTGQSGGLGDQRGDGRAAARRRSSGCPPLRRRSTPARSDIVRCAGGGIIRSSVATRYQLGLLRQAGSVTVAVERLDAPRDLRVGHERRLTRGDVGGERRRELLAVEEQEPVLRRQDRRHRRARGRVGDQRADRLALRRARTPRCRRGRRRARGVPASVITAPP